MEERSSSFTDDTDTHCNYSISDYISDTENINDTHTGFAPKYPTIHTQRKHTYRNTLQTHLHLNTNIRHYYNKNYRTHTGIYMTQ